MGNKSISIYSMLGRCWLGLSGGYFWDILGYKMTTITPKIKNNVGLSRNLAELIRESTGNGRILVDLYLEILSGVVIRRINGEERKIYCKPGDMLVAADRLLDRGFGKPPMEIDLFLSDDSRIDPDVAYRLNQLSISQLEAIANGNKSISEPDEAVEAVEPG